MTPQEFFDATVNAIRAQGRPSGEQYGDNFSCRYRGPHGLKCAAGFHVTDAEYTPNMEGLSVSDMIDGLLLGQYDERIEGSRPPLPADHVLQVHRMLAVRLQSAHDSAARRMAKFGDRFLSQFEQSALEVANDHQLVYTPPAAA